MATDFVLRSGTAKSRLVLVADSNCLGGTGLVRQTRILSLAIHFGAILAFSLANGRVLALEPRTDEDRMAARQACKHTTLQFRGESLLDAFLERLL